MTEPRLIIADDSKIMREMLQYLLQPDYRVVASVVDGQAAVEAAQQLRPELVVLDISMPVLNGLEAARQIKQRDPQILLLFVSEHRGLDYIEAAFQAGGSGYVLKSKMTAALVPAIRDVLEGREYGRP